MSYMIFEMSRISISSEREGHGPTDAETKTNVSAKNCALAVKYANRQISVAFLLA